MSNEKIWERLRQDNQMRLENDQRLSQNGNPHAIYEMARRYHYGWGVPVDIGQSLRLYDDAANFGHAGACVELARLYLQGDQLINIRSDLELAKKYSRIGSEANKDLYRNNSGYNQRELVEQATGLLRIAEYQESVSNRTSVSFNSTN